MSDIGACHHIIYIIETKTAVTQGSPAAPSVLGSWSGSGWTSNTEDDSKEPEEEEAEILPLDENGRIVFPKVDEESKSDEDPKDIVDKTASKTKDHFDDHPRKPEVSWEASLKAQRDVLKVLKAHNEVDMALTESREELHDETVLSLLSSLSGIEVLDRSSELESHPSSPTSSDVARNEERDDSLSSFNDSVEVFLAKQAREDEIITLSSDSDTSGVTTPVDDPEEDKSKASLDTKPRRGPPEFTFRGTRYVWNVQAQGALYPGGFVDDLASMGIPRELWPFPDDVKDEIDDTTTEECCDYKQDGKED